jgi:putative (di)nucleoside polyphosphate hydrolase
MSKTRANRPALDTVTYPRIELFRPNVCIIVVNKDGKFLLGRRNTREDHWQFPQGGMNINPFKKPNERDVILNGLRELKEELGIKRRSLEVIGVLKHTYEYRFDKLKRYEGRLYVGQRQRFLLVRFLDADHTVSIPKAAKAELIDYRWCEKAHLQTWAAPKRYIGYKPAIEEVVKLLEKT